ncbi:MAG: DUF998 domain-containing protein, partial [Trueperaceae bacterium]
MITLQQRDSFIKRMLYLGIAVPFLYFGIQLLAAPFFPNYSFVDHVASLLGFDLSTFPALSNISAIVTGCVFIIASFGFLRALQKLKVHWLLTWLTFAVLLSGALGNVWAGLFPMPDPRHGANPFAVGLFVTPFLLPVILWKLLNPSTKLYFVVNILLFGLLVLSKSGMMLLGLLQSERIFQRVFACIAFFPI